MTDESDTALWLPVLRDLTYRELHAFEHGLYCGFVEGARRTEYSRGREQHYWRMGYLATALFRYVAMISVLTHVL